MRYPAVSFLTQNNMVFIRILIILFLSCITVKLNLCFSSIPYSLKTLNLEGHFNFDEVHLAARDFGNRYQFLPSAVLHPKSVPDIATTIKHIWEMGPHSELTVAARGHGHSLQGQAQSHRGVVINMESLQGPKMQSEQISFRVFSSFKQTNYMVDLDVQIPSAYDPFSDTKDSAPGAKGYVHLRVQQRNGKKCLTTVQGLREDFSYQKILKDLKKEFCCNGNVVQDKVMGKVLQLQGDQRMNVLNFLVKGKIVDKEQIKIHGF